MAQLPLKFQHTLDEEENQPTAPPMYSFVPCRCGGIRKSTAQYCSGCLHEGEQRWRASRMAGDHPATCGDETLDRIFETRLRQDMRYTIGQPYHVGGEDQY